MMNEHPSVCRALAATLARADDPAALIPHPLPCTPLDLLVALHQEVTSTMLSDLAYAQRAASAARVVARRFPDDPLLQAQAHWTQGSALAYVPDYAHALEHYDAALEWFDRACELLAPATPTPDVRIVQIVRVFCLFELGRYSEAQQAVEAAKTWLGDHPNDYARLTLLLNRSFLAGSLGAYAQMIDLADETIALATELDFPAHVAKGWINRGYACIYVGRFAEAETALDRGIAAAIVAGEPITAARGQWNQARLLRCQGQLFAALKVLREAEQGLAQATGEAATIALEAASIYEQLRQLPEAQEAAHFAAEQFMRQDMPTYSASAALQAARIALQQRRNNAAHRLLRLAREQAARAGLPILDAQIALIEGEHAARTAPIATKRAHARALRAAREVVQQSVAVLQGHDAAQEIASGQLTLAAIDAQLGDIVGARAIYERLFQHSDHGVQLAANAGLGALLPSEEALPYLQRAAALAVDQRRALPMEELQARYSSETSPYHMRLAACYLALNQRVEAIEVIWASKAGALLDLRAAVGSLDAKTRLQLEQAKADIARKRVQAQDHAYQAQDAAQREQFERSARQTQLAQAAAAEALEAERRLTVTLRMLGDRSGQAQVPTLLGVQQALLPGMTLLEYARWDDDLICFLVQREQPIYYRRLGEYRGLAPLLDRWSIICRRLISDQPPADAHQQIQLALVPLWEMLLAPLQDVLATTSHLLIAPCDALHHVPWAALFDGVSYLGDRVMLTLTPCGAMWIPPHNLTRAAPGPPRLLGFAGHGKDRLAHVAGELAAIWRSLPDAQVNSEATAADLRSLPPPSLLHIAAHGQTNSAAPLCSTLDLADGPFLLLEAHRLNLRGTRLVVLSACETSVRPDHGDMALALAGAFLCAGAQMVLASLWRVADTATKLIMEHFYAALAAGERPAAALHQAQQSVRATHPLDWAAFQLWAGTCDI